MNPSPEIEAYVRKLARRQMLINVAPYVFVALCLLFWLFGLSGFSSSHQVLFPLLFGGAILVFLCIMIVRNWEVVPYHDLPLESVNQGLYEEITWRDARSRYLIDGEDVTIDWRLRKVARAAPRGRVDVVLHPQRGNHCGRGTVVSVNGVNGWEL